MSCLASVYLYLAATSSTSQSREWLCVDTLCGQSSAVSQTIGLPFGVSTYLTSYSVLELESLALHECTVDLGPSEFDLPALTHLKLDNVGLMSHQPDWTVFLNRAAVPSLTSLVLIQVDDPDSEEVGRVAALTLLAPRLVSLILDDEAHWIGQDETAVWAHLTSLQHLHITSPYNRIDEEGRRAANCFRSLLAPLVKLNVSTDEVHFASTAYSLYEAFRERRVCVQSLEELVLPVLSESVPRSMPAFQFESAVVALRVEAEKMKSLKITSKDYPGLSD